VIATICLFASSFLAEYSSKNLPCIHIFLSVFIGNIIRCHSQKESPLFNYPHHPLISLPPSLPPSPLESEVLSLSIYRTRFSAMSLLNDLININLSDTTEKIIAEYLWYLLSFSFVYDHIYDHQVT